MQRNIVRLSEKQSNDMNILTKVIKSLGEDEVCPACCSGKRLSFEVAAKSFEDNSKENVKKYYVDENGNLIEESK
jgi:hypothetical protein